MTTIMSGLRLPLPFLSALLLFCVFASNLLMINALVVGVSPCHQDQIQILTKFKNEFDSSGCSQSDYFNGVRCDNFTGAVTKLQLPSGCLSGTLKHNSSLFELRHLRYLNLSYNDFTSSSLPSRFGNLNKLEVLSLSSNGFFGQVPSSFNNLGHLSLLDLSYNKLTGSFSFSKSLTKLSILDLSSNYFSSGTLNPNSSLFKLHQLRNLDLAYNNFTSSSIPCEFGNLNRLEVLSLSSNGLIGQVPSSFSNLSRLTELILSHNDLTSTFPPVHNLTNLSILELDDNHFFGTIPSSLFILPFFSYLDLKGNHLTGPIEIPNSFTSSRLENLNLGHNQFGGEILKPISKLINLNYLDLSFLNISYPVDIRIFSSLKALAVLVLSGNSISPTSLSSDSGVQLNMKSLVLSNCNITEFPNILKPLENLQFIDLSSNIIKGKLPEWLWSLPRLSLVALYGNLLNGFQGSAEVLVNSSVKYLDLQSNLFDGELPLLPHSIRILSARGNRFTGNIPLSICNYRSLMHLMLPDNNFTGPIPQCLNNLMVMDLRNNNLEGSIPDVFYAGAPLRTLDVGYNQLTGNLPRSLLNCTSLKFLVVDHNRIQDRFPFWLKVLPRLTVVTFRSNKFYGSISPPDQGPLAFPELRILEISNNNFTGSLPPSYFLNWKTSSPKMDEDGRIYMGYKHEDHAVEFFYVDSLDLLYKGLSMEQAMVLSSYSAVDFSGNRIEGHIPESIGLLKELIALNLSNNAFTGHIPLSLSNVKELESLDLSRNQLSGNIPRELGSLSFLAYINVSHNHLKGEIPQGPQFSGQAESSFEGNVGLCGIPLQGSCFASNAPPTQQPKEEDKEEEQEVLNWKAVAIGYGPGVLLGLALAQVVASYKSEWLN